MRKTFVIQRDDAGGDVGIPALIVILIVPLLVVAQQQTDQQRAEKIDLNVIHKIKTAELGNAGGGAGPNAGGGPGRGGRGPARPAIMETMYNLTDRYGPR